MSTSTLTNQSTIKSDWIENVAGNYFDFDDTNNYNIGIFGYVNEVMANAVEDGFNAISLARREFYPVTAKFTSSLYDMATLQSIDVPLTTPSTCKCALILDQDQVIENSTFTDGVGECVIDSCLKMYADDLQFMIDYPIIILSKYTDVWSHTVHYDTEVSNSLNTTSSNRYISNKVIKDSGKNYLILFIDIVRQLEMTEVTKIVSTDSTLDTFTIDVDFTGEIANFEVFYKESTTSDEVQLSKVMLDGTLPSSAYVQYKFINDYKIRLVFEYNSVFNPKYNSEIICRIYTSSGADGNFNSFDNDLPCSCDSDTYPYNANMSFVGRINGSATGGADKQTLEEFRDTVVKAYSTNNTITTSNDLQIYFDDIASDMVDSKVLFKKKRDDPFIRLFGAYTTMKDSGENIVPTNTLQINFNKSDFATLTSDITKISIPPGTVFQYESSDSYILMPARGSDGEILNILDISDSDFENDETLYFTNPFMISVNIDPNNVGYYMNSIDMTTSVEYTYVNDSSVQQFIASSLNIYRNGVSHSDYYKLSIKLIPSTDTDSSTIVEVNDITLEENQIRATANGRVVGEEFYFDETVNVGYVRFTIEYDDGSTSYIQGSNTTFVGTSDVKSITGYKMLYAVGDTFVSGDILATKRPTDLGNLMIAGDLSYILQANGYYIPFHIQDFDDSLQAYTLEAYMSTSDEIDSDESIAIDHGIYTDGGIENTFVAIAMRDQILEMNVLYNNEGNNISNKYSGFTNLGGFTMTNTYISSEDETFDFITSLPFIRGTVKFLPTDTTDEDGDFEIQVTESPLLGAEWASIVTNYDYFISEYTSINEKFTDAFYALENNFSIDSKFYNTYGKARFYTVGNNESSMTTLNSVKISLRFGVALNTVSSTDSFITSLRDYIKSYIEDTTDLTATGKDIYIMSLISSINADFSEVQYMEYYGVNIYDYSAQKLVGPDLSDYWDTFVPEFINLDTVYSSNGTSYPNIDITILS